MYLVLCFEATRAEEGKTKQVEIHLADSDGNKLPGSPIRMNHILALNGTRFPKPGDSAFNILIAGRPEGDGRSQAG